MTLQEMLARQQEIVNGAKKEGRDLSPEEKREFDSLQTQINADGVTGKIGETDGRPQNTETELQRAVSDERQRISDIMALGTETGMDVQEHVRSGDSMDNVRAAAVQFLIRNGSPIPSRAGNDEEDNFRSAAADALLIRTGAKVEKPSDGVDEFRNFSLRDLAIECMSRDGMGSPASLLRMSKDDMYTELSRQFYNPTATFPAILDNTIKKNIVDVYQSVPTTFELWTSKGSVSDFKPTKDHEYLAGGAGEFLLVGENGELKHDAPQTELLPQRKIDTYGRQFSMSRQAFINDDIGFITKVPGMYATSAKRTINKQVYLIAVKNPAIFDGVALFDAAHGNLITPGTEPTNKAIQKMIMRLMLQKDPFGDGIMIQPRHIIVPVGYAFTMATILQSPTINTPDNTQAVNPLFKYSTQLEIVEEGAINAMSGTGAAPWFMVGDRTHAKSIQVDYLNGQETPTIRRSETPGQLGFIWDIYLDWGITAVDYRGIVRNDGVPVELN